MLKRESGATPLDAQINHIRPSSIGSSESYSNWASGRRFGLMALELAPPDEIQVSVGYLRAQCGMSARGPVLVQHPVGRHLNFAKCEVMGPTRAGRAGTGSG